MTNGENDNLPEPPFELIDTYGRLILAYIDGTGVRRPVLLGDTDRACEIMADFLAERDFGECAPDPPADEVDWAG
ncbi:MAG: hypothetical protein M3448_07395 [Pseudomonadota bacterium]|nr:hypothetical protein [Pseudomonadota bacterium]